MPREADGRINDLTIRWFEERAKGGVGFIMTGAFLPAMVVNPAAREGFASLAERMHSYNCRIGVQIVEGGPMGGQGPSPSPYPDETHPKQGQFDLAAGRIVPVPEVSVEFLKEKEKGFAAAAKVLKEVGIDCVELHCAHGGATLCCSFISPFYNRRTDEYGGSWENRLRFPTESIRLMREAVSDDYPILARIDVDELLGDRGITPEDAQRFIVPALEEAGVDCIDASQGSILHSPQGITIPGYYPRGCFIENAAAVKQVAGVPVIGVGAIFDMDMAERFLREGKADIIYMGRQVTCDPETPKKYFEGRAEDIRQCIGCVAGCGRPCSINYDIQDNPIPLAPAEKAKKVLVLGGGVAGMEAARVAAIRGHQVTLMEKEAALGGVVAALALNPLTAEFGNIVRYLSTQLRKQRVDVRVCKEASAEDVAALEPDVVIMATGSRATVPAVAAGKPGVMTHSEASRNRRALGQRVVVWGFFGAELAIALAEEGKDVTLLGHSGELTIGSDLSSARRFYLLRRLTDLNLVRATPEAQKLDNPRVLQNVTVEDISDGKITVQLGDNAARRKVIPYDALVLSRRFGERKANDSLFEELEGKVAEVYKIGDCAQARSIKDAIWTANEVVRRI
jgi:2,4-dienoyl-CoA reductase-like NADH-dependent reductase (Old Yellow Enzyme family)/thioredoxin reductase